MSTQHRPSCHQCGHENVEGARFCSACGTALTGSCPACGAEIQEAEARFCNRCGTRLEEAPAPPPPVAAPPPPAAAPPPPAAPAPPPSVAAPPPPVPVAHAVRAEAREEVLTLPIPEFLTHKAHRSQLFYVGIFLALAIITIVEIGVFYVDVTAFRVPSLFILSAAKFALVIMFFMHLKGDRRFFSLLFIGPLFIGAAVLLSLTGLFRNF